MKAIFALAFAGLVSASPISTQYVTYNAVTLACEPATGYTVATLNSSATAIPSPVGLVSTVPFGTAVTAVAGACVGTDAYPIVVSCSTGFVASGVNTGQVGVAGLPSNTTWATTANLTIAANVNGLYNLGTNLSFICAAPVCAYTCTGGGCSATSGSLAVNASFQTACTTGYAAVASPLLCPAAGLTNITTLVCTNDVALIPAAQWFVLASQFSYSIPGFCGCTSNPVCPTDGTIKCSQCYLSCTQRREDAARQATVAAAVFCPLAVTIDEMLACFTAGACAGAIQPGDTCVYGPIGAGINPCPTCPKGSKKGLLGLLGLLGLIPLLLCALLCCLLLLCIRRKKMERDVHFATFDAGAPPLVAAPHCHEVPTHSVHHATYVGAPHMDQHAHLAY
jgi:hypothetical protein